jgi:hypothetical protein
VITRSKVKHGEVAGPVLANAPQHLMDVGQGPMICHRCAKIEEYEINAESFKT